MTALEPGNRISYRSLLKNDENHAGQSLVIVAYMRVTERELAASNTKERERAQWGFWTAK